MKTTRGQTLLAIGFLSFALASSLGAQPVVEDQTGAPYPSDHVFLDRLDYTYPGAGLPVPQLSSEPGAANAIYLLGVDRVRTRVHAVGKDL